MEKWLQRARRVRSSRGGTAVAGYLRPAYWKVVETLTRDSGVSMRLTDGQQYRLDAHLFAWQPDQYEPEVVATLLPEIGSDSVVYDIGAHVGLITLMAASRVRPPAGHVYAFEPSPGNVPTLERHVRINGFNDRVTVLNVLVGDRTAEQVQFSYRAGEFTANSLAYAQPDGQLIGRQLVTVDDLVERQVIRPADVIKIDVEGYEHAVLKGAKALLTAGHPVVICALHPEPLGLLQTSVESIFADMTAWGYRAFNLGGHAIASAGFEEVVFREAS